MIERPTLVRLVAGHDATWEGWWPCLLGFRREAAHRRTGGSYPSLFLTARHMVLSELWWQERMEGRAEDGEPVLRSMAGLEREWARLRERRGRWLARRSLSRRVRFTAADGRPATAAAWECVLHVITHAHFHRGQLANQCRALGTSPPSRHLMGHVLGEF